MQVATQKVTVEKRISDDMNVAMNAAVMLNVGSSSVYHTFPLASSLLYSSSDSSRSPPPFLSYMARRSNDPTFMLNFFMLCWPKSLMLAIDVDDLDFFRSRAAFLRAAFSAFFSFSWMSFFFTSSMVSNILLYISKFTVMTSPSFTSPGSNPSNANDPPSISLTHTGPSRRHSRNTRDAARLHSLFLSNSSSVFGSSTSVNSSVNARVRSAKVPSHSCK